MTTQRRLHGWMPLTACVILSLAAGTARADLRFPQPSVDLGQIRMGQAIEHKFSFMNTGPSAVIPAEVKASCGCLHPVIEQRHYQPGESGTLTLKINTLSATAGPHNWRMTLQYRADNLLYETSLSVRAYVIQEIAVQPPAMMVYAAGAVQHLLTVTDLRAQSFRVLKVEGSSPKMEAVVTAEGMDAGGHMVRRISLKLPADYPSGRFDESVIVYTDDPQYKEIHIPVTVVKRSANRFTALPAKVDVVASAAQPVPTRTITIRDNQGQPVAIERVTTDDPAVSCQWAPGSSIFGTLKVTVDSAKMNGTTLDSKVQVMFRAADSESLTIPITCTLR